MTTAATDTKAARVPMEVKAVDAEERTFEGLLSTFDLDLGGDLIHRGAFKRTLDHWRKSGRPLPLIDSHNYGSVRAVVGKLLDGKETKDGLWTEWEVIQGSDGDEVLRRIEGGYVDGLSIGYRAVKIEEPTEEERLKGVWRHLKEVELREGSVVVWPMNPGARIDPESVKSILAGFHDRELTDADLDALKALQAEIGGLLAEPGLPADDPRRRDMERRLQGVRLHRLGSRNERPSHPEGTE